MREKIQQFCMELGFDAVGITTAEPVDAAHVDYFRQWLADGCAAEMTYLHRNVEKRFDPAKLLPGAKSVICVALNYRPAKINRLEACSTLRIARFAQYEDYHAFIRDRLFRLAEFIGNVVLKSSPPAKGEYPEGGRGLKFKACVDSVPIAERALAQRAGLGFIGKNHMLIHPELGSQILLGELITTLELEPDQPFEQIPCGDCGRCIRSCPTGALGFDGSFDARKCISYQTIEAPLKKLSPCQGGVPRRGEGVEREQGIIPINEPCDRDGCVPSYIFGCDECILACPHELNAPPRKNIDFQLHPEWQKLSPEKILDMSEQQFETIFEGSGFIRFGLERLKRNVAYIQQK